MSGFSIKGIVSDKKPLPILSFPGIHMTGVTVSDLVHNGVLQAECMHAVAKRWNTAASVSLMDLSVEAEAFGSPVRFSTDDVPTVTGAVVTDEISFNALRVPEVGEKRTGEYVKTILEAKKRITDRPVIAGAIGPYSLSGRLADMTEIMMMCYEDPDLVHGILNKAAAFLIQYYKAFKEAGADAIIMAEPAAGLLSPALNEQFSVPYVKRIIQAVSQDGFPVIYHNCGNTLPLIDSLLTTGAAAFHFGNAIRLADMLPKVPEDIPVFGNVDPAGQFRNGTPESVRSATLRVLEECSGFPHFALSSGCDIPPATPLDNIDAFFAASEAFYG
ncbi:MAG: uroporphyrinogen decarboxylase family protein [Clostridia bacterium]|nr:uroporphyrinogen decarboxylase family protein [Clostridia bacterium]